MQFLRELLCLEDRCPIAIRIPATDAVWSQCEAGLVEEQRSFPAVFRVQERPHDTILLVQLCQLKLSRQFAELEVQLLVKNSAHGTIGHRLVRGSLAPAISPWSSTTNVRDVEPGQIVEIVSLPACFACFRVFMIDHVSTVTFTLSLATSDGCTCCTDAQVKFQRAWTMPGTKRDVHRSATLPVRVSSQIMQYQMIRTVLWLDQFLRWFFFLARVVHSYRQSPDEDKCSLWVGTSRSLPQQICRQRYQNFPARRPPPPPH